MWILITLALVVFIVLLVEFAIIGGVAAAEAINEAIGMFEKDNC